MRLFAITLLLTLTIWILTSCASPGVKRMGGLDYPIVDIQKGIKKAFPVSFESVSQGGRRFETYPFIREGKKLVLAKNQPEVGRAIIEILGASRPYTVDVAVHIYAVNSSEWTGKSFRIIGYDEVTARIFLARLRAYLLRSKKSLDIVDDVRAF